MAAGRYRRDVSGILLLDKPQGPTSNQALKRVRWLYGAKRAGHTGSLDPMATGMLPICLGHATKVAAFLLDADKTYVATCQLGAATDTGDAEGQVTRTAPVPEISSADVERAMVAFRGPIQQIPPMYSALHHNGKRLYQLARAGVEVERPSRPVTVYQLDLVSLAGDTLTFRVRCSKGTYVRVLAEDLAQRLGTDGHLISLRRESLGPFPGDRLLRLEELEALESRDGQAALDPYLVPSDQALGHLPALTVGAEAARGLVCGQRLEVSTAEKAGQHRCYGPGEDFLGVVEVDSDGLVRPRRMFKNQG